MLKYHWPIMTPQENVFVDDINIQRAGTDLVYEFALNPDLPEKMKGTDCNPQQKDVVDAVEFLQSALKKRNALSQCVDRQRQTDISYQGDQENHDIDLSLIEYARSILLKITQNEENEDPEAKLIDIEVSPAPLIEHRMQNKGQRRSEKNAGQVLSLCKGIDHSVQNGINQAKKDIARHIPVVRKGRWQKARHDLRAAQIGMSQHHHSQQDQDRNRPHIQQHCEQLFLVVSFGIKKKPRRADEKDVVANRSKIAGQRNKEQFSAVR